MRQKHYITMTSSHPLPSHIHTHTHTGGRLSVNDLIMEMLIMCYGCKTAAARRIIGERVTHSRFIFVHKTIR